MLARPASPTLADAVLPNTRPLVRDVALVVGFGTLMALFARIAIDLLPLSPVPITGQTLGVLLTGALLGSKRGALAMLVYLGEGLIGLPVFAFGRSAWTPEPSGFPVIFGPTAGYLFSYPLAAFVVGWLAERGWDRIFWRSALAMAIGEVVIYAIALPWLARFEVMWFDAAFVAERCAICLALPATLVQGLVFFVPGDIVKLLVAAAVLPSGWRLLGMLGHHSSGLDR